MGKNGAPVVVMRWFRDGAGYAYDPGVDAATLGRVVEALDGVLSDPSARSFQLPLPDGRSLLGDKRDDLECLDERAVGRRPSVLRVAVLGAPVPAGQEAGLRGRLLNLPLPDRAGPQAAGLRLALPRPIDVPYESGGAAVWRYRWGPWCVLTALLVLDGCLGPGGSVAHGFGLAAGLLAAVGLYYLLTPPPPSRRTLNELEIRYFGAADSGSPALPADLLAADARIVLPDGSTVGAVSASGPPVRVLPQPCPEPEYTAVTCRPGLAVLQGRERLRFPGQQEVCHAFVRCYAWSGWRWRLTLVQWTAEEGPIRPILVEPVG